MRRIAAFLLTIAPAAALFGCAGPENVPPPPVRNVVEVIARGLAFEAPTEIPAGWATFRLKNESAMVHFALLERLPEGVGLREQQEQVAPVFQEGMDLLAAGKTDEASAKFGELPEWFGKIVFLGGPGLVGPERTAETTVYLEPGTYLLECYVKTNGIFHSYNPSPDVYGMVHELTVTETASEAKEPDAGLTVTISRARGIEVAGIPVPGRQTVAIHFTDQTTHENFVGHDVHLVRLTGGTDLEALAAWMDWRRPDGLQTPAPAEFLGGTNEMPPGTTAYLDVDFEPGSYAWIAEVPDPAGKGMFVRFEIPPRSVSGSAKTSG